MIWSKRKSDRPIFLFFSDLSQSEVVKMDLIRQEYEVFVFQDQDTLIDRMKEARPAILVFHTDALISPLSELVRKALETLPQLQIIAIGPEEQLEALIAYQKYNFSFVLNADRPWQQQLPMAIDKTMEALVLREKNDQLVEKLKSVNNEIAEVKKSEMRALARVEQTESFSLKKVLKDFEHCESKDELIMAFHRHLAKSDQSEYGQIKSIFLRYLPTVQSFVATFAHGLEIEKLKGVGIRLSLEETRNLDESLLQGQLPIEVRQLIEVGLGQSQYLSRPLFVEGRVEGVFLIWSDSGVVEKAIEAPYTIFALIYEKMSLARKMQKLDIKDRVGDFWSEAYFHQLVSSEMERAKRIHHPLTLIRARWDLGSQNQLSIQQKEMLDQIIAKMISKTGRSFDLSTRTQNGDYLLLLPHCDAKGGALRAERLRRRVEAHVFSGLDGRWTLSCGIAEYPTLVNSSESLLQSAELALEHVIKQGGNRVCLFTPSAEFKPDFQLPHP